MKILAAIFGFVSAALLIGSFFVPPMGMIDGSVLAGAGELFAWGTLFFAWESVDRGIDAKITHGNTTIDLNNPDHQK